MKEGKDRILHLARFSSSCGEESMFINGNRFFGGTTLARQRTGAADPINLMGKRSKEVRVLAGAFWKNALYLRTVLLQLPPWWMA